MRTERDLILLRFVIHTTALRNQRLEDVCHVYVQMIFAVFNDILQCLELSIEADVPLLIMVHVYPNLYVLYGRD